MFSWDNRLNQWILSLIYNNMKITQSYQIVQQRWPDLLNNVARFNEKLEIQQLYHHNEKTWMVNGIHLSSIYDKNKEAEFQASIVPFGKSCVFIYGVGLGDIPRVLLKRKALTELVCIVLNKSIFYQVIMAFDCSDWLQDERVHLLFASEDTQLQYPFATQPACLKLADEAAYHLRDQILLELSTPHIQQKFSERQAIYQRQIEENIDNIKSDGDVTSFFNSYSGQAALIIGSGPSLLDDYDWIRENRDNYFMISVSSAVIPLMAENIIPDVVVVIEPQEGAIFPVFDIDLTLLNNVPLVYFPIVSKRVLSLWKGERFTAYGQHKIYEKIAVQYPKGHLFAAGTVVHSAIDLAVQMGVRKIVLAGVDYAFSNELQHASGVRSRDILVPEAGEYVVFNGYNKKIQSSPSLIGFLRDTEHYISCHPHVDFYNMSRSGAKIKGAVYLDGV